MRAEPLAKDEAMIFVFDRPESANFWMKDTLIPLDIHFFNAKGVLTNSHSMPVEKNPAEPSKTYPSKGPISTALEVAPGAIKNSRPGQALCVQTLAR